jgi:hypothetical protein
MSRRAVTIVLGAAAVLAGVAAWRLWPVAFSEPSRGTGATRTASEAGATGASESESLEARIRVRAEIERAAKAWLAERARHVTPIESVEALRAHAAVQAARPMFATAGLTEQDVRNAVDHAATIVYLLGVRKDREAYTRWRLEQGYRFSSVERVKLDRAERYAVEFYLGRPLRDDELADSRADLIRVWPEIWARSIEPRPPLRGLDQTPEGSIVHVWVLSETLTTSRITPPYRNAAPSPISSSVDKPDAPERLKLWSSGIVGTRWPFWIPDRDLERRLEQAGTPMVEVGWVMQEHDGSPRVLSATLAMDRTTRRWWVLQWNALHDYIKGRGPMAGGL